MCALICGADCITNFVTYLKVIELAVFLGKVWGFFLREVNHSSSTCVHMHTYVHISHFVQQTLIHTGQHWMWLMFLMLEMHTFWQGSFNPRRPGLWLGVFLDPSLLMDGQGVKRLCFISYAQKKNGLATNLNIVVMNQLDFLWQKLFQSTAATYISSISWM